MKDHNCKCNHLKSEHEKLRLGSIGECTKCNCSDFIKRNRPSILDKGFAIFGIFVIAFGVIVISQMLFFTDGMTEEELNEPMDLTIGDFLELASLIIIAIVIISLIWVYDLTLGDYLFVRNRKVRD